MSTTETYPGVTRIEVIDWTNNGEGRVFAKKGIPWVQASFQDDGRTMKIFLSEEPDTE